MTAEWQNGDQVCSNERFRAEHLIVQDKVCPLRVIEGLFDAKFDSLFVDIFRDPAPCSAFTEKSGHFLQRSFPAFMFDDFHSDFFPETALDVAESGRDAVAIGNDLVVTSPRRCAAYRARVYGKVFETNLCNVRQLFSVVDVRLKTHS